MEHEIDLPGYLENSLSGDAKKKIEAHLESCPECSRDLIMLKNIKDMFSALYKKDPDAIDAIFMDSDEEKIVFPETQTLKELPEGIRAMLKKKSPFTEQLKDSLLHLKTRFFEDIDRIVDQLTYSHEYAYGLDKDITLPAQADLQLRIPSAPRQIRFRIQDHTIEIDKSGSGSRIFITQNNTPVSGIEFTIITEAGEKIKKASDENGCISL